MNDDSRLSAGALHRWRVRGHEPFGLIVEAVDLVDAPIAVIDVTHMPDEVRGVGQDDFPVVGAIVEAVVQGYTPSGQLRLSMLQNDVGPARSNLGEGVDE